MPCRRKPGEMRSVPDRPKRGTADAGPRSSAGKRERPRPGPRTPAAFRAGELDFGDLQSPVVWSALIPIHVGFVVGALDRRTSQARHADVGAGGGTRTRTTLPSRDFKSLASTSSATSASLISLTFLPFPAKRFPVNPLRFRFVAPNALIEVASGRSIQLLRSEWHRDSVQFKPISTVQLSGLIPRKEIMPIATAKG